MVNYSYDLKLVLNWSKNRTMFKICFRLTKTSFGKSIEWFIRFMKKAGSQFSLKRSQKSCQISCLFLNLCLKSFSMHITAVRLIRTGHFMLVFGFVITNLMRCRSSENDHIYRTILTGVIFEHIF